MTHRVSVLSAILALLPLSACGEDEFKTPNSDSCAVYLWEPGDHELETWPSMEYLREDASTATGYRFDLSLERFPALGRYGRHAAIAVDQLAVTDGFGVNASVWAEFSRPFVAAQLPIPDGAIRVEDPAGLVVFTEEGAVLWPVEIKAISDGSGDARLLTLIPLRPLPELSEVGFFVTRGIEGATADGCVSSSSKGKRRLANPAGRDAAVVDALVELGVIDEPADLVVLQPFVTQSVQRESVAIAADIAERPDEDFVLEVDPDDCEVFAPTPGYRYCTARVEVANYRDERGHVVFDGAGNPVRRSVYELYLYVWIPIDRPAEPMPMVLFGHGLSDDSMAHASLVLPFAEESSESVIVVGVDAAAHGNHPDRRDEEIPPQALMDFFGVEFGGSGIDIDMVKLRDNFRQSTYDKLQVTRAILANPDLDGDGVDDVDVGRIGYVGVSLGGIMGSELLALSNVYEVALLAMPGARVASIISEEDGDLKALLALLLPASLARDRAEIEKLFTMVQTVLDRGDAASYAPHVIGDRFDPGSAAPDVLALVSIGDGIVPNSTSYALARAMGLGVVPPVRAPAKGLAELDYTDELAQTISGNVAGGSATGGLIQFDLLERQDGVVEPATHMNLPESKQAIEATFRFLESHWSDGIATTEDPYIAAPLP